MGEVKLRSGGARTALVAAAVVLAAVSAVIAMAVVPPLFKKTTVKKEALAFGKLPAPGNRAAALSAAPAIGMPDGEIFPQPVYEYTWTGGPWPEIADKMPVYRRAAVKISSAEAKALAIKFGLTGEPESDSGGGVSAPGEPGGVEPSSGGQTEPPASGTGESEPPSPGVQVEAPRPVRAPIDPAPYKSFRFYDQSSGKRLEILETEGRFSYMVEGAWQEAEKEAAARPADAQAKEVALGFLKDKGLLPDDYTGPYIADLGVVSSAVASPDGVESTLEEAPKVMQPPYVEVQFGKKLGVYDLVEPSGEPSRYVASVTVGPGGAIMAASGELPAVLEESAYPLRSVAEAFDEVKKGDFGIRALGAPVPLMERSPDAPVQSPGDGGVEPVKPAPVKIELSRVKLAYLMVAGGDGAGFFEPAYLFSGKIGPPGAESDYSVAVPAVAPAHIKGR